MADEKTLQRLRALARERGVSFAEVVREALEDKAAEHHPPLLSVGSGESKGPRRDAARKEATRRVPPRPWR